MENLLLRFNDAFAQVPNKVLKYRSFVFSGLLVITTILVWGIFTRTSMDMSTDSFLDPSDPAIAALDEFRRQFGSDDTVYLVYRARAGDIFSRESLLAIQQLTDDLRNWQDLDRSEYPETLNGVLLDWNELNHIRRVQSIANVRIQESVGDSLLSNRLVPVELPETDAELAAIKARALAQEDYLLAFYSADARYGAVMIQTDFGPTPEEGFVSQVDSAAV